MGLYKTYNDAHIALDATLMVYSQVGTDDTIFNEAGTGLISPISGTTNDITVTIGTNNIQLKTTIPTGQANGYTIREIEFNDGSEVYAREILPDTTKNDTLQVDVYTTIVHSIN